MARYIYVDNSNLWIEGQRLSAVRANLSPSIRHAQEHRILDYDWRYDFGRLHRLACPPGEPIGRVVLFGSRPPPHDSVWQIAEDQGFEVETVERNAANREKQVDAKMITAISDDSHQQMQAGDLVVLVTGDGDFVPPVESLRSRGLTTRNMFWAHGSAELRNAADEFCPLDGHFAYLSL